jgi:hypothetical protein
VIQKELVDPIARLLLSGEVTDGEVLQVRGGEGKLEDRAGPGALGRDGKRTALCHPL